MYERLFREALRIRLVEERIISLYPSDKIQSPVHLSIGQESVAVCLCAHLRKSDWVFINYRGHAFYLAKGAPLPALFAELYGKSWGLSGGKAGSMHLAAPEFGVMGASAVVASTLSHAVGAALAAKIKGESRIFVATFGDGATEQGAFHESINMAALYKVPVLFLCENNGLAVHTKLNQRQSYEISELAKAYKLRVVRIDNSFDLTKTAEKFGEVISWMRENRLPVFLEIKTSRYREHVGPGEDFSSGYRSESEVDDWKVKDPLLLDRDLIEKFTNEIKAEVNAAVRHAEMSPYPDESELLTHV